MLGSDLLPVAYQLQHPPLGRECVCVYELIFVRVWDGRVTGTQANVLPHTVFLFTCGLHLGLTMKKMATSLME